MKIVALYADGGLASPNPSPIGGSWAYAAVGEDGEVSHYDSGFVRPEEFDLSTVSANLVEFIALLKAFQCVRPGWSGTAYTDSKVSWERFRKPQTAGMRGVPDSLREEMQKTMQLIGDSHQIILLEGHPTKAELQRGVGKGGQPVSRFNVFVDKLCRQQALTAKEHFQLPAGNATDEKIKFQFD